MTNIKSPYERELITTFEEKLMAHLAKPKVRKRLERTGKIDKEIKKFSKRYDLKFKTDFSEVIGD